jgi:hypothetical protein
MRNNHPAGEPESKCRATVKVPTGLLAAALVESAATALACLIALAGVRTSNEQLMDGAVVVAFAVSWLNVLTLTIAAGNRKRKRLTLGDPVARWSKPRIRGLLPREALALVNMGAWFALAVYSAGWGLAVRLWVLLPCPALRPVIMIVCVSGAWSTANRTR